MNLTPEEMNKLNEISIMQDKLDEEILKVHECQFDLERSKLALIDELGETNHENKANWCWWKFTQEPVNKSKLLEELVDCWHFAMSIYNHTRTYMDIKRNIKSYEVEKYQRYELSKLIAWVILKTENILAIMIAITNKLGFTIDEIYTAYVAKNRVNYERLKNGY